MQLIPNLLIIPVGVVIGLLVSAPVGPVNVLCIQRAIERGFWGGLAAGSGAILGDGLVAFSAAMGVGAVSGAVEDHRTIIQAVGGFALLIFGATLYLVPPRPVTALTGAERPASLSPYLWDMAKTFLLTITNPGAVLGLFAIFGGISTFVEVHSTIDALALVASVIAGSILWWSLLSHLVSRIRERLTTSHVARINKIAGALLFACGLVLIGELVLKRALLWA